MSRTQGEADAKTFRCNESALRGEGARLGRMIIVRKIVPRVDHLSNKLGYVSGDARCDAPWYALEQRMQPLSKRESIAVLKAACDALSVVPFDACGNVLQ